MHSIDGQPILYNALAIESKSYFLSILKQSLVVAAEFTGWRLDKALAAVYTDYSRTMIQGWLDEGRIRCAGEILPRRHRVRGGEVLDIDVPDLTADAYAAEAIEIKTVFEDDSLLVVNKPAGMAVHPGAGRTHGTLLNALLAYCGALQDVPRAGIVHRLDKNTSGLLVVAKTRPALWHLIKQFKSRTASRQYLALVEGRLIAGGTIDAPIGRHRRQRTRMTVDTQGKEAITHYRVVTRFRSHTLVRAKLETGRTHQIRVHFRHGGFPVVGDRDYGSQNPRISARASGELIQALRQFKRQALHAESLELVHPVSHELCRWHVGLPADMRNLILVLKADKDSID